MIVPNGNTKKYIKTIIGIFILYTIISPIITKVTGNEIKIDYSEYEKYFENNKTYMASENYNTKIIENTYIEEIKKKIKGDIENMNYSVKDIYVSINMESGVITSLSISVDKYKESYSNIISINEIHIGTKSKRENTLSRQEIEKIKNTIKENYGIEPEKIRINSI